MHIFYFFLFIGLALIAAEVAITTFYLLVIGVIFIIAGLISLIIPSWVMVSIITVVLSVLGCLWVNRYKARHKDQAVVMIQHVGHSVEVIEIGNNKLRIKYSGSYWDAKLMHKDISEIKVGDILKIAKYHNNEFFID
jgi:membrane protein implicated in regulation of membrane protease activity